MSRLLRAPFVRDNAPNINFLKCWFCQLVAGASAAVSVQGSTLDASCNPFLPLTDRCGRSRTRSLCLLSTRRQGGAPARYVSGERGELLRRGCGSTETGNENLRRLARRPREDHLFVHQVKTRESAARPRSTRRRPRDSAVGTPSPSSLSARETLADPPSASKLRRFSKGGTSPRPESRGFDRSKLGDLLAADSAPSARASLGRLCRGRWGGGTGLSVDGKET